MIRENAGIPSSTAMAARERELQGYAREFLAVRTQIKTGFDLIEKTKPARERILSLFGASTADWADWRWHLKNRITSVERLSQIVPLAPAEVAVVRRVEREFRWAISPYYASLLDPDDPACPLRRQAIPSAPELAETGELDPVGEGATSPVPGVVRRYPDRLIIYVTNQCAMFCRHCQRRRHVGRADRPTGRKTLEEALAYIRRNEEIRDVLVTGGDALLVSDSRLEWLLTELDRIPHVEIKRIGTRCPVTMPQRVTSRLAQVLRAHPPLYVITQFNHPREVTPDAAAACARLVNAGAVLGNQSVLLRGVNDDAAIIKALNHALLAIRVRPYYLFHALPVRGTLHFRTRIEDGMAIIEKLRGYTSGLAIPTYAVNAPGGGGKVPLMPQYVIRLGEGTATVRTWEGRVVEIPNEG
jgi:lysine 2,3-aminomutase